MTVGELKAMLEEYPEDIEVVINKAYYYLLITKEDSEVIKGVKMDGWIARSHPTMEDKYKAREKDYLLLDGE